MQALAEVGILGGQQPVAQILHAVAELVGVARFRPQVGHHILELALLVQVAQDHVDLTDDQLEHEQFRFEQVQHRGLDRAGRHQIENVYVVRLADAAETADALLNAHGVPR